MVYGSFVAVMSLLYVLLSPWCSFSYLQRTRKPAWDQERPEHPVRWIFFLKGGGVCIGISQEESGARTFVRPEPSPLPLLTRLLLVLLMLLEDDKSGGHMWKVKRGSWEIWGIYLSQENRQAR